VCDGEIDAVVGLLEGGARGEAGALHRCWPRSKRWQEAPGYHWPRLTEAQLRKPVAPLDLTPREREILAHIVAGRTYGEIARDLVISEKTVSVHVSHLLHKAGTTNRVELA
jgi:DNA-binding NarL/FixJ family response regulator